MSFCGYLRGNTSATIKLGPFLDSTDGNTDETALTISQADVRLSKNGGDYAQKNDSNAATHDEIGMYDCAINATDTNTYGRLRVTVHESGALTVDQTYMVLPEIVFDSLYPSAAGAPLPVFGILDWGTAQASAAGTLVHRSGLNLANDIPNGATEFVYGGTGAGQARVVHDFTNSSDTANISPDWTTTPSTDSTYATFASPPASTSALPAVNTTQLGGDSQSLTDLKDFADAGYDPSTNKVEGVKLADTTTTLTNTVTLADGAHGGASATITAKSVAVTNSDAGGIAVNLVGSGTGNSHALRLQSTNGHGLAIGSTSGNAINAASTSADAVSIAGGTNSDGIQVAGNGTGVDIRANITGNITGTLSELTAAIADSVPADGSRPSIAQALYMLTQFMLERSVSGTTVTVNKPDGTTALMTLTLNDGTSPTAVTRAT